MEKENKNMFLGDKEIRKVEHNGELFFSIIDIIHFLTNSTALNYCTVNNFNV